MTLAPRRHLREALQQYLDLDVRRFRKNNLRYRRVRLLDRQAVAVFIDVGGSVGEYATELRRGGYARRILSIEPRASAYRILSRQAQGDPLWETLHCALGPEGGDATLNISGNPESSSFLPMLRRHVEAFPGSQMIGVERVRVERLDDIVTQRFRGQDRLALKLDVQGYEDKVLDGAGAALERCELLELELSLVPLYEGQALIEDFVGRLRALGFRLVSLEPRSEESETGECLFMDGLFLRSP